MFAQSLHPRPYNQGTLLDQNRHLHLPISTTANRIAAFELLANHPNTPTSPFITEAPGPYIAPAS